MAGKENSAMTILMDFAKPCKGKLIGSVILAVLGALCGMIPYLAVSRGIIMICHEDYAFSKLAFLALIAFAGYLGQVWFGTFSTMKSHESAFIILRNIRMAITEKLSRVPMGTILDTPSGKFKTIIVDTVEKLELPLAHMVPELTANILIPILMLVYLFSLDWRLALISLVTIPVGAFCYMGMMKDYEKRYARVLAAGKNMDAATVEYIGGIEVVKTFNQGERSYKKYADAVAENETAKVTWFKQTNGYYVMGLSILTATLVGVLPLGSWLFINGRVEASTLITCIILALGLVKPLIQALQYTDSLAMVDSTVKEVGNLLDESELVRPTERAILADADVSFDHVTFRYKETEVLHGISFACAKNGMTAIVGPSGSGKSTIARLIASFWEAESGCVRIGGVDVRNIPLPQIMELVSYVSQDIRQNHPVKNISRAINNCSADRIRCSLFFYAFERRPCIQLKAILEQQALCHGLTLTNSIRIPREQFFLFIRHGSLMLFFISGNQAKHFLVLLAGVCVVFGWFNGSIPKFFQSLIRHPPHRSALGG